MSFNSYNAALDHLYTLRTFGTKLGLKNIRFLLDELGKPDTACDYLHIAGTNGKGSTASFLASILQKAGLKVGLFSSPHLVKFTERIQINNVEILENDVAKLLDLSLKISKKMGEDGRHRHPTFFEVVTAIASRYFADQNCDVVVWETGMGGRLDATNAVTPVASIITNISLEHTKWLGNNILEIASEKAGIIKSKIPCFTAEKKPDVLKLFKNISDKINSNIINISDFNFKSNRTSSISYSLTCEKLGIFDAQLALQSNFQIDNAALATIAAYYYLTNFTEKSDNLPKILTSGLKLAKWTARFQLLFDIPLTYLDCAHNQEGINCLTKTLLEINSKPWTVILGVVDDKNILEMITNLSIVADEIWYIKPTAIRGLTFEKFSKKTNELKNKLLIKNFNSIKNILKSIHNNKHKQFIICGSCYLVGDILAELKGTNRDLRTDDPIKINSA